MPSGKEMFSEQFHDIISSGFSRSATRKFSIILTS